MANGAQGLPMNYSEDLAAPLETPATPEHSAEDDPRGGLLSVSFVGLVVTQFLVALNDNMFRWLIVPIGKELLGAERALSFGLACFVLPYLLFASIAGYLADRFSKRYVIVGCKIAEIVIMALGVAAILSGSVYFMFVVLFLMGTQSALFSPSKLGSIPEIVRDDKISAANGVIGMSTVLAIIVGSVAGGVLYELTTLDEASSALAVAPGQYRWWISASALIGVAVVGWLASLTIRPLKPANPERTFPWNPFEQTVRDLGTLIAHRPLLLAGVGTAFFWGIGALVQITIDQFAEIELGVTQGYVGPLLASLSLGIGLGSVLAGVWSCGRVELGIVPIGAAGIAVVSMLITTVPAAEGAAVSTAYYWACFWLFLLGCSSGLYDIPLAAFIQHRSPVKTRGSILAASNFITFSAMFAASGAFWLLTTALHLSPKGVFFVVGLVTLLVLVVIVYLIPFETVRFIIWIVSRIMYRVRIVGLGNVPAEGGVLLVANHVSWADGVLLGLASPRHPRMFVYAPHWDNWLLGWTGRLARVIPVYPGKKSSVVAALRTAREALKAGEIVCIFPEGGITRTGEMQEFQSGFMAILKGTNAPIVPVHLGGLWGSIFSFERGRFFWKLPRRWPYPVKIRFGMPIEQPTNSEQVRQAVEKLGEDE